jgi:hypothetical protein
MVLVLLSLLVLCLIFYFDVCVGVLDVGTICLVKFFTRLWKISMWVGFAGDIITCVLIL